MMNGSANGSSSANSSTRAMRMGSHVEEPELTALPLELSVRFELEHPRNQAVPRMKHERVERALGTGAVGGGVLGERELEKGVQLHALAAAAGVLEDHATGADVAGTCQPREPRGQSSRQRSQIPIAQLPTAVSHTSLLIEQSVEAHQRIHARARVHHLDLEP